MSVNPILANDKPDLVEYHNHNLRPVTHQKFILKEGNNMILEKFNDHLSLDKVLTVLLHKFKTSIVPIRAHTDLLPDIHLDQSLGTQKKRLKTNKAASTKSENVKDTMINAMDGWDTFYQACETQIRSRVEKSLIKIVSENKKTAFTFIKHGVKDEVMIEDVIKFTQIEYISGQKSSLVLQGTKSNHIESATQRGYEMIVDLKPTSALRTEIPKYAMKITDAGIQ